MKEKVDILEYILKDTNLENATPKEIMVANILYLLSKESTALYEKEYKYIDNHSRKEYENIKEREDNIVKIIYGFKILLKEQGKSYLENKWGIKVEELTTEIESFEQAFKSVLDSSEEELDEIASNYKANFATPENETTNDLTDAHISILYGFSDLIWHLNKEFKFVNLYISFIKDYKELKNKIYNAATRHTNEYITELRLTSQFSDIRKTITFDDCLAKVVSEHQEFANNKVNSLANDFKETYDERIQKKDFTILSDNTQNITAKGLAPLALTNKNFKDVIVFLCENNKKYIYMLYHSLLTNDINNFKESNQKYCVVKLLYDGYYKWCKKKGVKPQIELHKSQLIEYPSSANDTPKEQHHFPKKRFIDNPINEKREKLNKYFLEALHKGMIEGEIIAKDTELENLLFVFGYGGDIIANFKPIQVLKPNTNYARENGKRTIRYLLEELMKYSDDEIRPLIKGKRHLILNSCFSITDHQFKSSDFEKEPIYKGSEISKIRNIYDAALNKAKEQNV